MVHPDISEKVKESAQNLLDSLLKNGTGPLEDSARIILECFKLSLKFQIAKLKGKSTSRILDEIEEKHQIAIDEFGFSIPFLSAFGAISLDIVLSQDAEENLEERYKEVDRKLRRTGKNEKK